MAKESSRMPTLFLSHGAPDMALRETPSHKFLAGLGKALPAPKAILAVSAHWETEEPRLTASPRPPTIHDFQGFPPELYTIFYSAPGAPELAERIAGMLPHGATDPERGLDHGAWSPLILMYPAANIPVIQLSVQSQRNAAWHYDIGQKLAPLRDEGILIAATGNTTHNLRAAFRGGYDQPPHEVTTFSAWLHDALATKDHERLKTWESEAPYAQWNHPTPEHLLPLFVALGAAGARARATLLHDSIDFNVLAMDSYSFN
jgi:4,5-DOPA dioxygenase extradiol